MHLRSLVIILFVVSLVLFPVLGWAGEVCFSDVEAKKLLKELSDCRYNIEIIKQQEMLIENLKKQNELLQQEIELLKEQVELMKQRADVLQVAYEEERKKARWNIFSAGKWFGMGLASGIVIGILILH